MPEAIEKDMFQKAKKIEWSSKSYAEAVRKIKALRANAFSRI